MRSRVRKGVPNSVRGQAWANISKAVVRSEETEVGVYADLILRSCVEEDPRLGEEYDGTKNWYDVDIPPTTPMYSPPSDGGTVTKETIERDINRTFPRHSMFYDEATDSDSGEGDCSTDTSYDRLSEGDSAIGEDSVFGEVEVVSTGWAGEKPAAPTEGLKPTTEEGRLVVAMAAANRAKMARVRKQREKSGNDLTVAKGGQAMLRRVLRAYSVYDEEVGYCQGMNFIAAMFITYVSEEQAFWLLVAIMQDPPCQMRGLFGEGMSEAHQVLFVAQKLITQFLPRLSRHLHAENVDITMFATQWLLTMYTSSFPFDIVTRIWDCFLVEGWKVTYRVMLALLEGASGELIKLRFEDILGYLKDLPHRVDHDALMEATFKIPLRKKHITKYAKMWEKMQKEKEKKRLKMERNGVV